ncbi:MAG: hypothetical protein LBF67_08380, partial [Prevotellaceae bacterium]|nr:hypothetical protein [Prevotellaceae bacterium]
MAAPSSASLRFLASLGMTARVVRQGRAAVGGVAADCRPPPQPCVHPSFRAQRGTGAKRSSAQPISPNAHRTYVAQWQTMAQK